jgi:hypothetical protein
VLALVATSVLALVAMALLALLVALLALVTGRQLVCSLLTLKTVSRFHDDTNTLSFLAVHLFR